MSDSDRQLRNAYLEIRRLEHALCNANLLAALSAAAEPAPPPPPVIVLVKPDLTTTELEVLRRVAVGESIKETSAAMFMCESTVKTHITKVYAKLGVHNRAGATMAAIKHELVEMVDA